MHEQRDMRKDFSIWNSDKKRAARCTIAIEIWKTMRETYSNKENTLFKEQSILHNLRQGDLIVT